MGSFYYWSGHINSYNMTMRGVVHVVKKRSYMESLTYKVGTVEPKYEPSGELNILNTDCHLIHWLASTGV